MSDVVDIDEFAPGADPLRPAFEALSAAATPVEKLAALKCEARKLATPIRHGLLDFYDVEERLLDLAESHDLFEALSRGTVEVALRELKTPALHKEQERVNGHGAAVEDAAPPLPRGPQDYGTTAAPIEQPVAAPPLTLDEWAARGDLAPPDCLMGSWLTTTTRCLLYAPTGLGKSLKAMALGMHAAAGRDFLHWQGRRPSRVLYIDGEMARRLLRERLAAEVDRMGERPANFFALSHDDVENFAPLNTAAGQAYVDRLIAGLGGVDLVIFDAIMSLLVGDPKENEPWAQVMPWVKSLTKRNIGQLWVHHTGHDTTRAYGDKTREWQLDTVIALEPVDSPGTDVSFSLTFRKARERTPATRADFADTRISLIGDRWQSDGPAARKEHVSPLGRKFYDALLNVLAGDDGVTVANGRRATNTTAWKAECARSGLIDPEANAKSATALFNKHRRELISANHIVCNGDVTWTL